MYYYRENIVNLPIPYYMLSSYKKQEEKYLSFHRTGQGTDTCPTYPLSRTSVCPLSSPVLALLHENLNLCYAREKFTRSYL